MLTILHDSDIAAGNRLEIASAEGALVTAPTRATCKLAAALIEQGYPETLPVRVVRANPWLWGPPYYVSGVSLKTVAEIDFFAEDQAETDVDTPRIRRGSDSAVR